MSARRIIVERPIADEFTARLAEKTARPQGGRPEGDGHDHRAADQRGRARDGASSGSTTRSPAGAKVLAGGEAVGPCFQATLARRRARRLRARAATRPSGRWPRSRSSTAPRRRSSGRTRRATGSRRGSSPRTPTAASRSPSRSRPGSSTSTTSRSATSRRCRSAGSRTPASAASAARRSSTSSPSCAGSRSRAEPSVPVLEPMAEIVTLADAVDSLVEDGQTVALEGFTHLIPHAAGHEIVRQGRRDLTLVRMTPDIIYDQLIGAGCARKLIFSWGGNPGVGSLHRFRDAVEHEWPAPLELEEHSHAGMATAYAAGAANLPFARAARLPRHRPGGADAGGADRLPVHRRAALGGARASGPTSGSSTPSRPTSAATSSSGGSPASRRRSCSPRRGRSSRSRRSSPSSSLGRGRSCSRLGDHGRRARAGRRASVVRARLLRPRQRLLRRVGRDQPRPRLVHGLDAASTCSRPRRRGVPAEPDRAERSRAMGPYVSERLHGRRDDGRRRRAPPARRHRRASSGSARRAAPPTSPGGRTPPAVVLIYESGTIGAKPQHLPLSIGDGELAETADAVVSVPEIFAYWLQGGPHRRRLPRRRADRPVRATSTAP